jgi:hypothetical protein
LYVSISTLTRGMGMFLPCSYFPLDGEAGATF